MISNILIGIKIEINNRMPNNRHSKKLFYLIEHLAK